MCDYSVAGLHGVQDGARRGVSLGEGSVFNRSDPFFFFYRAAFSILRPFERCVFRPLG